MSLYSKQPLGTGFKREPSVTLLMQDHDKNIRIGLDDSPLKLLRRSFSEFARLLALGREFASVLRDSMKYLESSVVMVVRWRVTKR